MKNPILILLAFMPFIYLTTSSCHKAKPVSVPTVTTSPISGLTSVRHKSSLDTGLTSVSLYLIWNFTGTNPVNVIPNTDSSYFGHEQLSFSGSNVTQLNFYNTYTVSTNYVGLTTNINYTSSNQIDTITLLYTTIPLGGEQFAFQYSGDQITKVAVAHANMFSDTFNWSMPDIYYYTYTGSNITQILALHHFGTLADSEIHTYSLDSRANNFTGSMSTFLALEFIQETTASLDPFLLDMPIFINANLVDSVKYGPDSWDVINITNVTDAEGRITQRIYNNATLPDTFFYSY